MVPDKRTRVDIQRDNGYIHPRNWAIVSDFPRSLNTRKGKIPIYLK
jgi:hypothetical protein